VKLGRSKREATLAGASLEVRDYAIVLWAANPAVPMEAWTRSGRRWRDWEVGRWRLMFDGVQVLQGEVQP